MFSYENPALGGSYRQASIVREDPVESDVVGITFTTLNRIMTQEHPDELLALYCFYAKETKRQNTQQIWCTTAFVCHGLKWGHEKVKRVKNRLRALGLIENLKSKKKDGKFGKPYILVRFVSQSSSFPTGGETSPQLLTDSKGSASDKRSKETKETASSKPQSFSPEWKPDQRSKEEKLKSIRVPSRYPSEREFDEFVYETELDEIVNKRPDLYDTLTDQKWHHWNEKFRKWVPIRDWRQYVASLNSTISSVF